jgi:hypothetical protein
MQMDRHDEAIVAFCNFANVPENVISAMDEHTISTA